MSTKNYIVIAGIIKAAEKAATNPHCTPEDIRSQIAADLASYFKSDNERFDIPKFIVACGL